MFKDYYKILGISPSADNTTIKRAYREMSLRWHPDRNPDIDVTAIMQDINEAYAILKDEAKRLRYNQEYARFRGTTEQGNKPQECNDINEKEESQSDWAYEYEVHDENLKKDIKDAQVYAKKIVEEFFKELKETSKTAAKGATSNVASFIVGWVIAGLFISIISGIFSTCN